MGLLKKKKTQQRKPTIISLEDGPKAIIQPVNYTVDFKWNGIHQQIQIEWTEYAELPEVLHKWLKKQGIDNKLVIL